jgi:hypothetical protein
VLCPFVYRASGRARTRDLDIGHAAERAYLLDRLPLSPNHNEALGLSAISTVAGLTRILNEVGDRLAATGGTTT